MQGAKNISFLKCVLPSLLMLFALVWLSVSTPFVYAAQQAQQASKKHHNKNTSSNASQTNTVDEDEVVNSVANISEYLHSNDFAIKHFTPVPVKHTKCHPSDLYFAYHPELISPPPEA
jgi:hypothetical protein